MRFRIWAGDVFEWALIFVVRTALGAAPMAGMPVIQFKTYQACMMTARKFNGPPPRSVMTQQRLAVCESLGDQKPDDEEPEPSVPDEPR